MDYFNHLLPLNAGPCRQVSKPCPVIDTCFYVPMGMDRRVVVIRGFFYSEAGIKQSDSWLLVLITFVCGERIRKMKVPAERTYSKMFPLPLVILEKLLVFLFTHLQQKRPAHFV